MELQTVPDRHRLVLNVPFLCYGPTRLAPCASNMTHVNSQMAAAGDGPDEALYHVSLLFKCVQRESQPDLLFIPSKPPYP